MTFLSLNDTKLVKISSDNQRSGITCKSILTTIFLIPFSFYWIIAGEIGLVGYALNTYAVPFYNVIFTVFILLVLNLIYKKIFNCFYFSAQELLVIYILLSISCALPSITLMTILITTLGHAFWFDTPENEWRILFWDALPTWLTIQDRSILSGYYLGESTIYRTSHFLAWLRPALFWSGFMVLLMGMMLCLNILLRKQWIERERLTYPIAQLPFQLLSQTKTLISQSFFRVGASISISICLLNGLHFLLPSLPEIPVKRLGGWKGLGHVFTEKPWSAIGRISVSFYPFVIGLGFLMPIDLLFSSWFFFLFYKIELIISSLLGLSQIPGFPYVDQQCFGAILGLFLSLMILGWHHFQSVVSQLKKIKKSKESKLYRVAILGLIFCFFGISLFSVQVGMRLWLIPIFFGLYFVTIIVLTRIRAELGFPAHAMEHIQIDRLLIGSFGSQGLGKSNLVALTLYRWFIRSYSSHPMPHQLEGFKIVAPSTRQHLYIALVGFSILSSVSVFWVMLHLYYQHGAVNFGGSGWSMQFGSRIFGELQRWLTLPIPPNPLPFIGIVFGFGFSLSLMWMRTRFLWFPLHPVGFLISSDWGMAYLWTCMLLCWAIKLAVLKVFGLKGVLKLRYFSFGLILGDFLAGGLWSFISIIFQKQMYNFWP